MCFACGVFCGLTSIFGVVFLAALGGLIRDGYQFVGEWYDKESNQTDDKVATQDMRNHASNQLYLAALAYGICILLSAVCVVVGQKQAKRV